MRMLPMQSFTFIYLSILALLPYVVAHGFLSEVSIDGRSFKGNVPYDQGGTPFSSIIRRVASESPVRGATSPYLPCGVNSTVASIVSEANPGSEITYLWQKAGNKPWDHKDGPIIVSITECTGLCRDNNDLRNNSWAVLAQSGKVGGTFPAQEALYKNGTGKFTLPSNLARGQYVVRVEIIALFAAEYRGGAEFYPGCFQIQVEGSETGKPSPSSVLARYPGSYKDTDAGILITSVYDANATYPMPGPPIATFVSANGSSSSGNGTTHATTPSSPPISAPAIATSSSTPTSAKILRRRR